MPIRKIKPENISSPRRLTRSLEQKKPRKPTIKSGHPLSVEGSEGDITVRRIDGEGIFQYTKVNGEWLSSPLYNQEQKSQISSFINSHTSDGDMLVYDSSQGKYVNKSFHSIQQKFLTERMQLVKIL